MELPELFFERHPDPMLIYDTGTLKVLEVNKSAENKYGYSRDEFRKLTIEDIRPPEDIALLREQLDKLNKGTETYNRGTFRHQTKKGDLLYVQVSAQDFPMPGKNARIVHIHDLTQTVRLKNEMKSSLQEQQHHIDNNPLGMVKYDANFRIIEWSRRAEEKTGFTKDEMLGRSSFEAGLFDEDEAELVKKRMLDLSSGKQDKDRFETVVTLKDGGKMEVLVHASALRDEEGNLKSVLAFIENISARKNYERELEKREEKYHRLFEDATDGIFVMNGMKFVDCNQRVTEIFGCRKEEIIGKTPMDFSPEIQPDGRLSSQKAKEKIELVNQGKPQVFEWKHQALNGKMLDVDVSLNEIELGGDTYIQAILRDLTEHKKIKNELVGERQRLKRAQNLARLGWWSYEVKEDRVVWSDVLFDILNVNKNSFDYTFEAFYELVHPQDQKKFEEVMEQAQTTRDPIDYMLRIKRDDKIINAKCRAQAQFNREGDLVQLSGVLQDVTAQVKAQEQLKRNEELFESLFVDSPVAIAMIDVDGKIQNLNKSFEILFGYSEEELLGKDLLKHQLPEERYDEIEEIYEHVFADEGSSKYYEDQRITKGGEVLDLLVGALPVSIEDELIAAFGIYTDITKLRRTEENLQNSLKEKEILLSEVHHRVKNNLAVISGLLELESMDWEDNQEVRNVLNDSMLRIKSIAMIHEQLYQSEDFANMEFDNYVKELVELISDTLNVNGKQIVLEVHSDNLEININQAIPCALIINELVTNSYEHGFEGVSEGKLKVNLKVEDERVHISVIDNGKGLPDDFDSAESASLGLTMVKQLTRQLNGELDFHDKEGTHVEVSFKMDRKSGSASNHFI